jgi:hypothetical protein
MKSTSKRVSERKGLLLVAENTYPTKRDNVARLFAILMQRFEVYESQGQTDISTRRKYFMKHHRSEYKSIINAIKIQRCTFMDLSRLNCNDNLKPYKWIL